MDYFIRLTVAVAASCLSLGAIAVTSAQAQQNSCPYIGDGDCDEPNGLNLCAWGTDAVDCSNPNSNYGTGAGFAAGIYGGGGGAGGGQNTVQLLSPCPYAGDGDCDEPNGLNLCAWGTDAVDCSNPNSNYGNGPGFAAGVYGGGGGAGGGQNTVQLLSPCPYVGDGDCDEPNGLNLCAWGTDAVDCSNPNSNYGGGIGFAGGNYGSRAPAQVPPPLIRGAPTFGGGSGGSFVTGGGGGSFGCPNYATQNTAFGQGTLNAGGAMNAVMVPRITAGGRHALANCFPGTGWRGFTITRPDYRLFYQGNSPTGQVTFSLVSNATDTVLLINAPDGQWYFNDDSNGTYNSTLTFAPAQQGQYDIWAGSYNQSSNNPAQLWISE